MPDYQITAEALRLLEQVYGSIVRFHDRQQVLICTYCHGQRTLHRPSCPFGALGLLIDQLQIQESGARQRVNPLR